MILKTMRTKDKLICFTSLVLAVALLWAAGVQIGPIKEMRADMGLELNPGLENAPPSLAFATVAMGAFRGLVVDILWMRADNLKQEGQFFDAKQLADWICALQPRFGAVWEFQAWNMAYNISVAIPASQPDQRWRWVRNGYELLRDRGIPLNPKNLQLYRELARIFQHKIGGIMDDCHKYYKMQLAYELDPLISPVAGEPDAALFDRLCTVYATWDELEADPNVLPILEALRAADDSFQDRKTFPRNFLMLLMDPNRFDPTADRVLDAFAQTQGLTVLDLFVRAFELRNTWKLDPVYMHKLNKELGPVDAGDPNRVIPLDWRHPDTQAIYWASLGLKMGAGRKDDDGDLTSHEMNTDRIIIHSLQSLYRYGKYNFYQVALPLQEGEDPNGPRRYVTDLFLRPDHRMFERYVDKTSSVLEKYEKNTGRYDSLRNGYRNFLENSVFEFYTTGHHQYAERIFRRLAREFPLDPDFQQSLFAFARMRLKSENEGGAGINDAREWILAQLREAYGAYALGDDDRSFLLERMAQENWVHYQTVLFPEEDSQGRVGLAPFERMRYMALVDFLNDPLYPPYLKQSFMRRMEVEQPETYQQLRKTEEEERNRQQLQQAPAPSSL